ncbi:MAG: DUF1858 domain-containing protein [Thermoanaerobaculia bacterium]
MPETTAPAPFTKEMTVSEAMRHHPVARWVFFSFNLSGCNACSISEDETLEQLSAKYGIPLERLLGELNAVLQ